MIGTPSGIVDYLGTHQHLATDLEFRAADDGGLVIRSGEQRFYEGALGFTFPGLLTGRALVRERFDERAGRFRITVSVRHPQLGLLLGYGGSFECEFVKASDAPAEFKPIRHEART